jgi:PhnB protein
MSKVQPIPPGYHTVTPYLTIRDATRAIDFYKEAFGAVELMRMTSPTGTIGHAELRIGDSPIMLSDECPQMKNKGPDALGGTPVTIHLYVEDVDKVVAQAVKAGAQVLQPVEDKFYGDRAGGVQDPFGHVWYVSTHKEDVPFEEIKRRAAALFGGAA